MSYPMVVKLISTEIPCAFQSIFLEKQQHEHIHLFSD